MCTFVHNLDPFGPKWARDLFGHVWVYFQFRLLFQYYVYISYIFILFELDDELRTFSDLSMVKFARIKTELLSDTSLWMSRSHPRFGYKEATPRNPIIIFSQKQFSNKEHASLICFLSHLGLIPRSLLRINRPTAIRDTPQLAAGQFILGLKLIADFLQSEINEDVHSHLNIMNSRYQVTLYIYLHIYS